MEGVFTERGGGCGGGVGGVGGNNCQAAHCSLQLLNQLFESEKMLSFTLAFKTLRSCLHSRNFHAHGVQNFFSEEKNEELWN